MNKIFTFLIVVVVAVIVAAAALPYWFGMQAETAYQDMMKKLTEDGKVTVTNSNFQRGWFESTADATLALTDLPGASLSVLHRISHGPLPLDDDFQPMPLLARLKSQISIGLPGGTVKLPPMNGKTTVYLAGNSNTRLEMEAYKKPAPKAGEAEPFELDWKGLSGDFTLSADYKNLKGEMNAPLLQFAFKNGSFNLNKLQLSVDTQESPSGLDNATATRSISSS